MSAPAIAVLWKRSDGISCVVTRRGTTLLVTLERHGVVQQEQIIESPREAMDVAAKWRVSVKDA
jgi:hypothetical protein